MTLADTLVDTHAHLDASGGLKALDNTVDQTPVTHVLAVTNLPRHFSRLQRLEHERVTWALGLHPGQPHSPGTLDEFMAALPTCTAVGEVGLDGTPATSRHSVPMDRQREELDQILNHPETARRLVTIHSRRAVTPIIEHLASAHLPGAILHWFTGTPAQARKAADLGAWFSVNDRMRGKTDLLAALPRDHILLETDAPYTGKTSTPGDLRAVLGMLADAWGMTASTAEDHVINNQRRLRDLLDVHPEVWFNDG